MSPVILWAAFNIFVIAMLQVDLKVLHRESRRITVKESIVWTLVWVGLALLFNLGIYFWRGEQKAIEFMTSRSLLRTLRNHEQIRISELRACRGFVFCRG